MLIRRVLVAFALVFVCSGAVLAQAQLAVNGVAPPGAVSVAAGSTVTVAVSGGPANAGD